MPTRSARAGFLRKGATLVGAGLFLTVVLHADLKPVFNMVLRAGSGVALILLAPVVSYVVHSAAWWMVIPKAQRPPYPNAFRSYLGAQSVDDLALAVVGEPLKVLELPPQHRDCGWSALIVDNLAQLTANATFLLVMLLAAAVPVLRLPTTATLAPVVAMLIVVTVIAWVARPV